MLSQIVFTLAADKVPYQLYLDHKMTWAYVEAEYQLLMPYDLIGIVNVCHNPNLIVKATLTQTVLTYVSFICQWDLVNSIELLTWDNKSFHVSS